MVVEISCEEVWREISDYLEGVTSTELRGRMESTSRAANIVLPYWMGLATSCS
jgi:hypothetical protein